MPEDRRTDESVEPLIEPPADEPGSVAEGRPTWVKAARVIAVVLLMPIALGLAAWPLFIAGGYRLHWTQTEGMAPSIRQGQLVLLVFSSDIEPEIGRVYAIRVGTERGGRSLLRLRRVVATEGDQVAVLDGRLVSRGEERPEPYGQITAGGMDLTAPDGGAEPRSLPGRGDTEVVVEVVGEEVVVPEGHVVALPDDRSKIHSRSIPWVIPVEDVYAEVFGH
jgi:hypothetical protein